jgi:hypothetical protein
VWDLVGNPPRYPEWWPKVIEVRGEHFEQGDEYAQVTRAPGSNKETSFLVERREELRAIRMTCQQSGMFADWQLTEALGGTFVDMKIGLNPKSAPAKVVDVVSRGVYFRRWGEASLDALDEAACQLAAADAQKGI